MHVPIINKDIPRSRVLKPGEEIQVLRETVNIDDMHFPYDEFEEKLKVEDQGTLFVDSRETTNPHRYYDRVTYSLSGVQINETYRDDEYLHRVRLVKNFRPKQEVKIEWEPTIPPQSRR